MVHRPEAEWASATAHIAYQVAPPVTGEVTGGVTGEVGRLLKVLRDEMKRTELQNALGLKHEDHFRDAYLKPALELGMVEMTLPDKPRSRLQKYRLTAAGRQWLQSQHKDET